jgi:hypothetical protein
LAQVGSSTPTKATVSAWNLAPLMPEGRDYSRINHGRRELIDHILVSAALVRKADSVEAVIEEPLPSVSADLDRPPRPAELRPRAGRSEL